MRGPEKNKVFNMDSLFKNFYVIVIDIYEIYISLLTHIFRMHRLFYQPRPLKMDFGSPENLVHHHTMSGKGQW